MAAIAARVKRVNIVTTTEQSKGIENNDRSINQLIDRRVSQATVDKADKQTIGSIYCLYASDVVEK